MMIHFDFIRLFFVVVLSATTINLLSGEHAVYEELITFSNYYPLRFNFLCVDGFFGFFVLINFSTPNVFQVLEKCCTMIWKINFPQKQ